MAELVFRLRDDSMHQTQGKLLPDHGKALQQLFLGTGQPIDTGGEYARAGIAQSSLDLGSVRAVDFHAIRSHKACVLAHRPLTGGESQLRAPSIAATSPQLEPLPHWTVELAKGRMSPARNNSIFRHVRVYAPCLYWVRIVDLVMVVKTFI